MCKPLGAFFVVLVVESVVLAGIAPVWAGFILATKEHPENHAVIGCAVIYSVFFVCQLCSLITLSMGRHMRKSGYLIFYLVWGLIFHLTLLPLAQITGIVWKQQICQQFQKWAQQERLEEYHQHHHHFFGRGALQRCANDAEINLYFVSAVFIFFFFSLWRFYVIHRCRSILGREEAKKNKAYIAEAHRQG